MVIGSIEVKSQKSKSRVDDLVKAGALIAAEIDRLLREEKHDKRKAG